MPQIAELATAAASTVWVDVADGQGAGSVIKHVRSNSYVLTCRHVSGAEGASVEIIRRVGNRRIVVPGVVERDDEATDLALVRTARRVDAPVMQIAEHEPDRYSRVYGVGNGSQFYGLAFEGILCGLGGSAGPAAVGYLFTGLAVGGMSGGPLVNDDGEQVGVIRAVDRNGHLPVWNIGHAVPLPEITRFLDDHGKFAKRKRPR